MIIRKGEKSKGRKSKEKLGLTEQILLEKWILKQDTDGALQKVHWKVGFKNQFISAKKFEIQAYFLFFQIHILFPNVLKILFVYGFQCFFAAI